VITRGAIAMRRLRASLTTAGRAAAPQAVRRSIKRAWSDRRWRWPRRAASALAACALLLVVAWHGGIRVTDFPLAFLDQSAASSLAVTDAGGALLRQEATSAGLRERWVSLDKMSPHLINATLDSEDHEFYDHAGVSWSGMARAMWLNVTRGDAAFGGSTITMQLVRLTAGTPRSTWGKLRQMVLAGRLERSLTKREILEHYLNRVYYGNRLRSGNASKPGAATSWV
jgi:membrane peptidoglycan carboxypeptidase